MIICSVLFISYFIVLHQLKLKSYIKSSHMLLFESHGLKTDPSHDSHFINFPENHAVSLILFRNLPVVQYLSFYMNHIYNHQDNDRSLSRLYLTLK